MHPDAPSVNARLEAYKAVLDDYGIDPNGTSYSGEEDAAATIEGDPDYPLERYCVVTHSGEYVYAKCHRTFDVATKEAVANCDDSLYAESPGTIIDLDTGAVYEPVWDELPWRRIP